MLRVLDSSISKRLASILHSFCRNTKKTRPVTDFVINLLSATVFKEADQLAVELLLHLRPQACTAFKMAALKTLNKAGAPRIVMSRDTKCVNLELQFKAERRRFIMCYVTKYPTGYFILFWQLCPGFLCAAILNKGRGCTALDIFASY